MRKSLETCWIAILFILLLSDDSLSRKPRVRFRSGWRFSPSKTKVGSGNFGSFPRKPAFRRPNFSSINFGSNKIGSFSKPDLFVNVPDISEIMRDSAQKMHDLLQRVHSSSPNKSGSPKGNNSHNPIDHQYNLAYSQNSNLFTNMPNVSQIMPYSLNMRDLLQRVHDSSPNKSGSQTGSNPHNPIDHQHNPAYPQNSDLFTNMPNVSQIMLFAQKMRDLLQRLRDSPPNKSGSPTGNDPHNPIDHQHNPAYQQNTDHVTNMPNVSQIMFSSQRIRDLFQRVRNSSRNKNGSSSVISGSPTGKPHHHPLYVPHSPIYLKYSNFLKNMPSISEIMSGSPQRARELLQRMRNSFLYEHGSPTGNYSDNPV
ncbi:uncharacterized protein LOC129342676 [Eublepharis macularius]|uniref:Uncharacterized protein LOC129342676 n=1 Tax=Eublepharis macularius TaxID=481883 RepID=A0AA97LGK8_EUBMA|nr:uncharacterized protein LOC129342676 [Eublepharis macularius]